MGWRIFLLLSQIFDITFKETEAFNTEWIMYGRTYIKKYNYGKVHNKQTNKTDTRQKNLLTIVSTMLPQ